MKKHVCFRPLSEAHLETLFAFLPLAFTGNILVAGFNFGTGSSREQAATALKHGMESAAHAPTMAAADTGRISVII